MAEHNASDELPGHVPGQFPATPGETTEHDYIKETGPFRSGGPQTSEQPPASEPVRSGGYPGGGAAGTYSTSFGASTHQRHRSFGRPAASHPADRLAETRPTETTPKTGGVTTWNADEQQRATGIPEQGKSEWGIKDTAVVGGTAAGVGAAGVGAYELSKDRDQPVEQTRPTETAPTHTTTTTTTEVPQQGKSEWGIKDTAIAGGAAAGVGAAGVGAYELSKDRDQPVEQTRPTETAPTHTTTTEVPRQEESHTGRDAAIAGGAVAGAGAAGYGAHEAYETSGKGGPAKEGELESRFNTYNLNDPNPQRTEEMKEQQKRIEERKLSASQEGGNAGEYATAGGVAAAAAGAGGVAAASDDRRKSSTVPVPDDFGAYDRAGKGVSATEGELENKFATYELNDPNPGTTEAMKEKILKIEEEKKAVVGENTEDPKEKKGFLSKILGGGSKDKDKDAETETTSSSAPTTEQLRRSSGPPAEPHEEHLVIHKAGSHPDAPTLVVREKP